MNSSFDGLTEADIFSDKQSQALARAACEGDSVRVADLLAHGADANDSGKFNVTPLTWAIVCDGIKLPSIISNEIIISGSVLVETPPDPEYLRGIEKLLESGADPNILISGSFGPQYPGTQNYVIDGYSSALIAAEFRTVDVLRLILKHGADPNGRNFARTQTVLGSAYDRGDWLSISSALPPFDDRQFDNFYAVLDAGADISLDIGNGENVLEKASLRRPKLVLDVMKKYKYRGNYNNIVDRTLLRINDMGIKNVENVELLNFLKENGASDSKQ
jgi:ankyrin repeat protein